MYKFVLVLYLLLQCGWSGIKLLRGLPFDVSDWLSVGCLLWLVHLGYRAWENAAADEQAIYLDPVTRHEDRHSGQTMTYTADDPPVPVVMQPAPAGADTDDEPVILKFPKRA